MGYSTSYKLETKGKPFTEEETNKINDLEKQADHLEGELKEITLKAIDDRRKRVIRNPEILVMEEIGYNPFDCECKFYEHNKVLIGISKSYPETIFILSGEGEEAGDIWKKYYLNGKVQEAKANITFDDFDENKLQ